MAGTPNLFYLPQVLNSLLTSLFIKDQNLMIYSEHKVKERSLIVLRKKKDLDTIENIIALQKNYT